MADNKHYMVVTDLGLSLIEDAYNAGTKVNLVAMALGDSNGAYVEPDSTFTSLVNEFGREDIHEGNSGEYLIDVISYVGVRHAGKTVREFGLYDDADNLIAYGAYPESLVPDVGSSEYIQLEIEARVDLANASAVTITVNPIYPYATEAEAGIIKIIKEAEVTETDESKADDSKALTLFKLLKRKATDKLAGITMLSHLVNGVSKSKAASEYALGLVDKKASTRPLYTDVQSISLSHLDTNLFYPLVLHEGKTVGYGWVIELASLGGSSGIAYNSTTLVGYLRGGGYSDYAAMIDVNVEIFDDKEITIHSAWEGSEGFTGVVIYLRGGKNYTCRVNDDAFVQESGTFSSGGSVFPAGIPNPQGSDLTKASNIALFDKSGNYNNQGIFNKQNPPTPAEVKAVNIEGDDMTGPLSISSSGATPFNLHRKEGGTNLNTKLSSEGNPSIYYGYHSNGEGWAIGDNGNLSASMYRWFNVTKTEMTIPGGATLKTASTSSKNLRAITNYGYVDIGATNSSYCHFTTDLPEFYFGKPLRVNGAIYCGDKYDFEVFHDGRLPYELRTGNRTISNFKDPVFVPFTTTAPNTGYPGNYGAGFFCPRLSGSSYYGWGIWNETTSKAFYFMKQLSDGSGFAFDRAYTHDYPPTADEVGARPDDWTPTATEVGALQWKKVASGSCSIPWKNSTYETRVDTIDTGYSIKKSNEGRDGQYMVKIISNAPVSSNPSSVKLSYRGQAREVTTWFGPHTVYIDVYATGVGLSSGTGATGWELWELQVL